MYKPFKNPKGKKWYACGFCGRGTWMPMDTGHKTKRSAEKECKDLIKIESIQRANILKMKF